MLKTLEHQESAQANLQCKNKKIKVGCSNVQLGTVKRSPWECSSALDLLFWKIIFKSPKNPIFHIKGFSN